MIKYYTKACNFYYGNDARKLIKKKLAFSLCGNKRIAFDKIQIFERKKNRIKSRTIGIKKIKYLKISIRNKVNHDIEKITSKRKNFLKNIDFLKPSIMGILNLTPDSFSDGGKFSNHKDAKQHIIKMINSGADIIDIGGEATRPGSKSIDPKTELKRRLIKRGTDNKKVINLRLSYAIEEMKHFEEFIKYVGVFIKYLGIFV